MYIKFISKNGVPVTIEVYTDAQAEIVLALLVKLPVSEFIGKPYVTRRK